MKGKEIDSVKLNEAIEKFGSLQKANAQLEMDKLALEKRNAWLRQENEKLVAKRDELAIQIEEMNSIFEEYQRQLDSLSNQIGEYANQHDLFCGFMAMVANSPSVTDSIDILIETFKKLKEPGWYLPRNIDEMRGIFVRTVMGDYLKCFRCDSCGTQFIINKNPKYKLLSGRYQCPACHFSSWVKGDDSFLKAMVSEKQLENIQYVEKALEEYRVLLPFKAFLNVPCEICNKPVNEWDDYSIGMAIQGIGCGHTYCWFSEAGRLVEFVKTIKTIKNNAK